MLRVTTTDDMLQVYQDRDLSMNAVAQLSKGSEIQLGAATMHEGREWMEAILEDGRVGYVLGPSARGHTTLGGTPLLAKSSGEIVSATAAQALRKSGARQRHGCVTSWLTLMIIANSLIAMSYLFASGTITKSLPNAPVWVFRVSGVVALANVVFAVALFRWRKWGFWGFVAVTVLALLLNLIAIFSPNQSPNRTFGGLFVILSAPLGVAILYGVLQIGRENNGWRQME